MKRLVVLVVLAALLAPRVLVAQDSTFRARRHWTSLNTALAISSSALLAMDWSTSVWAAERSPRWTETNPLQGRHPSVLRVNLYSATTVAGNLLLARLLANPWRNVLLAFVTVAEIDAVRHQLCTEHLGLALPLHL